MQIFQCLMKGARVIDGVIVCGSNLSAGFSPVCCDPKSSTQRVLSA